MTVGESLRDGTARTVPAPPGPTGPRWRRMLPPTLVVGGLAAATTALHLRDPHVQGSWGFCPSAAMGIWCPGCGGLRAVNDLTHLQVVDAASSNLALVVALPFVTYMFARWAVGRWRGRSWDPSSLSMGVSAAVVSVLLIAFTVLRNLPAGSWLAP